MAITKATGWPAILLIYGLSLLAAMVVSEGAPALGGIAAEFHPSSPSAIGWVMSIPALVTALGGLLVGWLVDRTGDRQLLLLGGVVVIVGDIGAILAPCFSPLLAWRVVGGVGYVLMAVSSVAMMTRVVSGERRVAALALWSTVIPASFIGALVLGALLAASGWRWIFGIHAILTAGFLAVGAAWLPPRRPDEKTVSRVSGLAQVIRSPAPYGLGLSFAAAAFLQSGMIAVLAKLLAMRIGASEVESHSFGILAMLCNMGGAFAVGPLLNRHVPAWLIGAIGAAVAAISAIALGSLVTSIGSAIFIDCALMVGCGLLAGMWALLPQVAPSVQTLGATSGIVTQITLAGVLFGPPAAFAALGFGPIGFVVLAAIMLLGTAAAIPVWLRASRNRTASAAIAH